MIYIVYTVGPPIMQYFSVWICKRASNPNGPTHPITSNRSQNNIVLSWQNLKKIPVLLGYCRKPQVFPCLPEAMLHYNSYSKQKPLFSLVHDVIGEDKTFLLFAQH